MNEEQAKTIAVEAAQLALASLRKSQKRNRQDAGSGSEVIGALVKSYREETGLSISELGSRARVHPTTVGKVEAGQRGMSLRTFANLAKYLGDDYVRETLAHVRAAG